MGMVSLEQSGRVGYICHHVISVTRYRLTTDTHCLKDTFIVSMIYSAH